MTVPRSKLFIAGDRLDGLADALGAAPDALSIDLEDSVTEAGKASARQVVANTLCATRLAPQVWVRINGVGSGHTVADILALAGAHVDVVNLPKAEAAADITLVEHLLRHIEQSTGSARPIRIVPTIESARGLRNALSIALASPRVLALQLGGGDLSLSTGMARQGPGMDMVRATLCLAAVEAGMAALDSTPHGVDDLLAFEADALHARALGFRGKSCMLNAQVAVANKVFGAVSQTAALQVP
jgi:citrate lyase subunit beta/citryl-CoA lyase